MNCQNCNEQLPVEAKFCTKCGFAVSKNEEFMSHQTEINAIPEKRKSGNNSGTVIWGAIVTIIGIFVTIFSYRSAAESGGTYVVAYGAIIYGIITLIKGAFSDDK